MNIHLEFIGSAAESKPQRTNRLFTLLENKDNLSEANITKQIPNFLRSNIDWTAKNNHAMSLFDVAWHCAGPIICAQLVAVLFQDNHIPNAEKHVILNNLSMMISDLKSKDSDDIAMAKKQIEQIIQSIPSDDNAYDITTQSDHEVFDLDDIDADLANATRTFPPKFSPN